MLPVRATHARRGTQARRGPRAPGRRIRSMPPSPVSTEVPAVLRAEGRTVLIHCVDEVRRTPAVAALYAARHLGIPVEQALLGVHTVLPAARPNAAFMAALDRLGTTASRR